MLGRKNVDGNPVIEAIEPAASLPGGEVRVIGKALKPPKLSRPEISFNGVPGAIVVSSEDFVIAKVPYGAHSGLVTVHSNGHVSNGREMKIAQPIAENLHPVANPAVDLHILHGLHKQRDALDVFRCLAQSVNDFAGAGQALVAWFEVDVKLAGVDGGVDRTTADKRRHTRDVRVLTDDLSQHTLAFHHGLE